jgi:hypothetical protein
MYQDLPTFWISLVIFVAATAGFHVWLIWLQPRSGIFWKKVDYLWIGIAAFAIVGAISQVRTIVASGVLSQTSPGFEFRTKNRIEQATFMRTVLCGARSTREQITACEWFDDAIKKMAAAGQSADLWARLSLRPVDGLRDHFKQEAGGVISLADTIKKEASERLHLEAVASKEETIAQIPLIISLFLLPIAFGIRLTKVTAEVRLAKAKANANAARTA